MNTTTAVKKKRGARRRSSSIALAIASFLAIVITTYLGLLAVTFFIGRVVPIDPVLAIVGDRAPAHVVERVRQEMGFNLPYYQQFLWNGPPLSPASVKMLSCAKKKGTSQ